ncbi:hypothetical protein SAY87_004771 [Trapa incisa]|uniref:Peroxidase n=2 Tax=Trapa TaxID=22665 RepID=A0AAN7LAM0_TRANT|nr:hypothetical protein SAY87_004771 [Trapa incisa]KAK4782486.1 hypothetical protein SAY86_016588 [Trapa natans]
MRKSPGGCIIMWALLLLLLSLTEIEAADTLQSKNLQWHYYRYQNKCRDAEVYVKYQVEQHWKEDTTITRKLLRLLYSDCMVNGCDGSVLLEGPESERMAPQNSGLGGFALIEKIKAVLEQRCPGVVSCSDILNLATRDAAHLAGSPSYPVLTGRRDGPRTTAASVDLPSPSISWEQALAYFQSKGLDVLDLATLLGAHSTGMTHCRYITDRLYNFNGTGKPDPDMNSSFRSKMSKLCPPRSKGQPDPLVNLNQKTGSNYRFLSSYYSEILSHRGVFHLDNDLFKGNDTLQIVQEFAAGFEDFRRSFALSMSRMGNIGVLTGKQGEIRRDCRFTNAEKPN